MRSVFVVAMCGLAAMVGCSDTSEPDAETPIVILDSCPAGETKNPITGACEGEQTPDGPQTGTDPESSEDPGMVDPNARKEAFTSDDIWNDGDGDGTLDREDNCPFDANSDQTDSDGDGIGDLCDNCVDVANRAQTDSEGAGVGDSCSPTPVGQVCGEVTSGFESIAPNIYLLLDKSGSMYGNPMQQAKAGLDRIADELNAEVRFGFGAFPIQLYCGVSMTEFLPMGQHDAGTIKSSYRNIEADGGTSTPDALETVLRDRLTSELGDPDDDLRKKAVVLITDGEPNSCGELPGTINAAQALNAAGIPVYVVGFNFGSNASNLNLIADGGGTDAQDGGRRYYTADNAAQLVTVIRDISASVIACSYKLDQRPEDPDKIWVSVNGEFLTRNDYVYDGGTNTLTLSDGTCSSLRQSDPDATTLKITVGCKTACVPGDFWGCCLPDGLVCQSDADCCFGSCESGTCSAPCRPSGVSCEENADCCSGVCAADSNGNAVCIEQ